MANIFKAYDIRGIVPDQLNNELAYKIGRAYTSFMQIKNKQTKLQIAIGQDNRITSPELFSHLAQGITDQGADAIDIGLSSTPMLYFAVNQLSCDGGINITASHNPPQYNGFKMVQTKAIPLSGETGIKDIEKIVQDNNFVNPDKKGDLKKIDILDDYINTTFKIDPIADDPGLKIVVDASNGVSALATKKFFDCFKVNLIPLFFELDGSFPNHLPDPLEKENLQYLKQEVIKQKADLGIALDGDGDRIVFIDENGQEISSDLITALIGTEILKKNPGKKILYDLRSSWSTRETIENNGGIPIMCRVGHAFIKEQMRNESAIFAGELSGHFYFQQIGYFESPFLVVSYILNLLHNTEQKLSGLIAPLKKYFATGEINYSVSDKEKIMNLLIQKYTDANDISYIDGIRIEYNDWWFNVRASNTEPLLRLNLEAKTSELRDEKFREIQNIIKN